jgi:hypothetical protein
VQYEVERRLFNLLCVDMLSKMYGMKFDSSFESLMDGKIKIDLKFLFKNGRGITVDQFLQAK